MCNKQNISISVFQEVAHLMRKIVTHQISFFLEHGIIVVELIILIVRNNSNNKRLIPHHNTNTE